MLCSRDVPVKDEPELVAWRLGISTVVPPLLVDLTAATRGWSGEAVARVPNTEKPPFWAASWNLVL